MQSIRESAKSALLEVLDQVGAFDLSRHRNRHDLVILTYHHVARGPATAVRPKDTVFADEFEEHVQYLKNRYKVIDGATVRRFLAGEADLPARAAWIAFDDGYRDNYEVAFPLLRRLGISAGFFLTTDFVGRPESVLWFDRVDHALDSFSELEFKEWLGEGVPVPASVTDKPSFRLFVKQGTRRNREEVVSLLLRRAPQAMHPHERPDLQPMSWEQVSEMADAGMTIGSHTVSHQILSCASAEELDEELVDSRRTIEERTGAPCWCLAYPNGAMGDFGGREYDALARAGYECAFTQVYGFVRRGDPRFALRRVPVPSHHDLRVLKVRVSGLYPLLGGD